MGNCIPRIRRAKRRARRAGINELLSLQECNKCTRRFHDDVNNRTIYVFNYNKTGLKWEMLKKLKDNDCWDVIKHPHVLHYINEILIHSSLVYTVQILLYFIFLILLYFYTPANPQIWQQLSVTALAIILIFVLIFKCALKIERDHCMTVILSWFTINIVFSLFTYSVAIIFIWSPAWFNYDDYNMELKKRILWWMPTIAIISFWIKFLHILRKSCCGQYVLMMDKILKTFMGTVFIWIPTLLCFASLFQTVMKQSDEHIWKDVILSNTSSDLMKMLHSVTKTAAMMIGEVEANDILELSDWNANLLLMIFEVIAVIHIVNLMASLISLAVSEVSKLKSHCSNKLLRIKIDYCIEILHLSTYLKCCPCFSSAEKELRNTNVIYNEEDYMFADNIALGSRVEFTVENEQQPRTYNFMLNMDSIRFVLSQSTPRFSLDQIRIVGIDDAIVTIKVKDSRIAPIENVSLEHELRNLKDKEGCCTKFGRWLIGIDWNSLEIE